MKFFRYRDGLLAGGGVDDEENFLGLEELFQAADFLDEVLIDFLAAGGVEDLDVAGLVFAPGESLPGGLEDVGLAGGEAGKRGR